MRTNLVLKRWLAAVLTAALFLVTLVFTSSRNAPVQGDESARSAGKDWPLFGGTLQRNFVNLNEKNIPDDWDVAKGTNIKWTADLGSKGYGGPIVAGGKVFVGTNNKKPRDPNIKGDKGVVMCFDEATGKFLWQLVHDKLPKGREQDWPNEGICSSPFVEGNRLYYVSNRCEVVCADVNGDPDKPGTGKILWSYDMIGKQDVFPHNLSVCSPLVVGDLVFVVTANGVDLDHLKVPSPAAPSFLCLNKKEGEFVWKSNLPSDSLVQAQKAGGDVKIKPLVNAGKLLMHGQWSNPVYGEPKGKPMVIFPGGDGWLYAFEPKTGNLLWRFDCNPKDAFYELGPNATRNDFIGTPVVWEDRLYIAVGQDPEHKVGVGHLWCIDITKDPKNKDKDLSPGTRPGKKKGDPPDTIFDPKDPVNKDSALVWHYGGFLPAAGMAKPKPRFARSMSTCAVHDGLCYAADMRGYLFCFDAHTGEKYWQEDTGEGTWSSPYWVDGKVYIGNDERVMFIFPHGKTKQKPKQVDMGGQVRAPVTAANGVLFALTENDTKLLAIGKK